MPPGSHCRLLTAVRTPIVAVIGPAPPAESNKKNIRVLTAVNGPESREEGEILDLLGPGPAQNDQKMGRPKKIDFLMH